MAGNNKKKNVKTNHVTTPYMLSLTKLKPPSSVAPINDLTLTSDINNKNRNEPTCLKMNESSVKL